MLKLKKLDILGDISLGILWLQFSISDNLNWLMSNAAVSFANIKPFSALSI